MYWRRLSALFIMAALISCAHGMPELHPDKFTSKEPGRPYERDTGPVEPKSRKELPAIPDDLKGSSGRLNLMQLIDTALKSNPRTAYAWAEAKTAAAAWAESRGSYYPSVEGRAGGAAGHIPSILGDKSFISAGLTLNYLLLDFGGRSGGAEAGRQALVAANLNHNQAIQDVLRDVPQAYYTYLSKKALVKANEASLKEARTSLMAAEQRRTAGVATIADVLEARANEQQAAFDLASSKGAVEISRGALATAVGWPANTRFDTEDELGDIPLKKIGDDVDQMINSACKNRADLNAAAAAVKQMEAEVKKARSDLYPTISGVGSLQWLKPRSADSSTDYYGGAVLSIPVFEGFKIMSAYRGARSQLKAAVSSLEMKEEGIIQEVWNAYHNFMTSMEQLKAAKALLAAAAESYEVSMARYKAGAADIVELMTTQSQLADARSQLIDTRMGYYNNYAELIHSIGAEFSSASAGEDKGILMKEVE